LDICNKLIHRCWFYVFQIIAEKTFQVHNTTMAGVEISGGDSGEVNNDPVEQISVASSASVTKTQTQSTTEFLFQSGIPTKLADGTVFNKNHNDPTHTSFDAAVAAKS
jgi:hypothetical protein